MHPPTQFGTDIPQGPVDALSYRLAPKPESSVFLGSAVVREPE